MDNVIEFKRPEEPVIKNKAWYLNLAKETLTQEDYEELLCAILDEKYYEELHPDMKAIVDSYYQLKV